MTRLAIALLSLALFAAPLTAGAQAVSKKIRVGTLGVAPPPPVLYEMFKQGLSELGYTEGQHVQVVQQNVERARLPESARELVQLGSDIIFARGPDAVAAAAGATKTIPIVALDLESDPIALGYAKTLARPGGNVTGIFLDLPELSAKQLQLFQEVLPGLSRVALIGDPAGNAAQLRAAEEAARILGVQVQMFEGRTSDELDAALEGARRNRAGGVLIFSSPAVFYNSARIAALAREKRLPTVSLFTEFAEAGGLLTYGPSVRESYRRCGVYVGKLLQGAKPADLPIQRPEKFDLVINRQTAKALGLTIPQSVLIRADQVIE